MNNPYSTSDDQISGDRAALSGQSIRIVQIITVALIQGTLFFGAIVAFLNSLKFDGQPTVLTWLAAGISGLMFVSHLVIPRVVSSSLLSQIKSADLKDKTDREKFDMVFPVFQTQHIIACALLEGAAFLCLVACLIDKSLIALSCAIGLLCLITARFPTASRVQFWVENRIRETELS